jgi:hypothetical protein
VADETNDEEFKGMLVRRPRGREAQRCHAARGAPQRRVPPENPFPLRLPRRSLTRRVAQAANKANAEQLGLVHKARPARAARAPRRPQCAAPKRPSCPLRSA